MEREMGPAPEGDYRTMHMNWLANGGSLMRLAPPSPSEEAENHANRWKWQDGKWHRAVDGATMEQARNETGDYFIVRSADRMSVYRTIQEARADKPRAA